MSPLLLSIVKDNKQGDEHKNKTMAEDCKIKFPDTVLQKWNVTA
jgi:hypothetical protein